MEVHASYVAYSQLARAGEELAILVETDGHDAVRCVESLFNTVSVMYVNVDIQDTLMISMNVSFAKHLHREAITSGAQGCPGRCLSRETRPISHSP